MTIWNQNQVMGPEPLRIGQRVRVSLSAGSARHGHLVWEDGATGVVVDIDGGVDRCLPIPWCDRTAEPPDHDYRVRFESPLLHRAAAPNGCRPLIAVEELYTRDELEPLPS